MTKCKICEWCGIAFEYYAYKNKTRQYCSIYCKGLSWRNKTNVDCQHCGMEFRIYKHKEKTIKYCSIRCRGLARRTKITVNCKNCNAELKRYPSVVKKLLNVFCNRDCKAKWESVNKKGKNNPNWKGGKVKIPCDFCGNIYKKTMAEYKKYPKHYCSAKCRIKGRVRRVIKECEWCGKEVAKSRTKICNHSFCNRNCRHKWMCNENNPAWKGGIKVEPYPHIWASREYKESIKERDGYRCSNPYCWKTSQRLIVHHINYNKKNCKPLNLITLCNSCNSRANIDRDWHEDSY